MEKVFFTGIRHETARSENGRIAYLDYLRLFAAFSVVVLHTAAQNWYINDKTELKTLNWLVFNFYHTVVRWAVPVFVMISGALFLGRNIPVKKIFGKYIFRLLLAFLFWNYIYVICRNDNYIFILIGEPHMWFIPVMMGLYLFIPVFNQIVKNATLLKYVLRICAVLTFALPFIKRLFIDFAPFFEARILEGKIPEETHFFDNSFLIYALYFLLGYYISKTDFSLKTRKLIYIIGFISFSSTFFLQLRHSFTRGIASGIYYNSGYLNIFLQSVAVFTWFKYTRFRESALIARLAGCCFTVYLTHILILQWLSDIFGLTTLSFHPIGSVPIIALTAFAVSMGFALGATKVPLLRKYIV